MTLNLHRASLLCALAASVIAQGQPPRARYTITDLGTLGGTFSIAFDINNAGRVTGAATVPGEYQHGFIWENGQMIDIGTLGGLYSGLMAQAGGRAGRDEISILSEIAVPDPLNQDFCGFGSPLICRAGVWRSGVLTPLPTLGGNNAAALTGNTPGQIVGLAEDGVADNTCMPPQKSRFQAVVWEAGKIRKLPPLPGDEVGMALRINDKGQAVGTSGLCANTLFGGFGLGPHAVLWENGAPIHLGDLGDPNNGVAAAINNRGEVFGAAGYTDGTLHAFRWTQETGMQDLGLMSSDPADAANTPFNVNDSGQMVGSSCDATFTFCRGYIWENGQYTDINTLLPADTSLYVLLPFSINQTGQITGLALDFNTFEAHAFLATPTGVNGAAPPGRGASKPPALPNRVGKLLRKRLGLGLPGARPVVPR